MKLLWICAALAAVILLAVLVIAYVCYRVAFYVPRGTPLPEDVVEIPKGRIYEPFRQTITDWTLETRAMSR